MKNVRRYNVVGAMYFITCVTFERRPILTPQADLLHESIDCARGQVGFSVSGWCILPDHCHLLIGVGGSTTSVIVHLIKQKFSALYRSHHGLKRGRLWQNRYWDHLIRDQMDFKRHLDYVHYNPVHHGLVNDPFEYRQSSLSTWYERDFYQRDWGVVEQPSIGGDFGE